MLPLNTLSWSSSKSTPRSISAPINRFRARRDKPKTFLIASLAMVVTNSHSSRSPARMLLMAVNTHTICDTQSLFTSRLVGKVQATAPPLDRVGFDRGSRCWRIGLNRGPRFLRAGNWDRGYGAWGVRCGAFNVMDFASGGQKYFRVASLFA